MYVASLCHLCLILSPPLPPRHGEVSILEMYLGELAQYRTAPSYRAKFLAGRIARKRTCRDSFLDWSSQRKRTTIRATLIHRSHRIADRAINIAPKLRISGSKRDRASVWHRSQLLEKLTNALHSLAFAASNSVSTRRDFLPTLS